MATATSSLPPRPLVLTYEDLRAAPDDGCRYEILEGQLHVTPAPNTTHQRISRNLEFVLHTHVLQHGLGEVLYAPIDVILDRDTVVQPDIVFVSSARSSIITERGIEGAPDLVIEILSAGTEQRDRGFKQQLYGRYGVAHYWRIDPAARSLTELVLHDASYAVRATHIGGAEPVRSALFPTLPIELASIFPKAGA
jgi:Uma2 family endonuclease